jgi:bifunctional DNA-binding transcriptional regulator/antitoxin component of YhaV-PrlF toxin-antitoxin module
MQTRRKSEEKNIRKITKMAGGASYGLTIPIEMIRDLGWREKQKVKVKRISGGIVIRDYRSKK